MYMHSWDIVEEERSTVSSGVAVRVTYLSTFLLLPKKTSLCFM